MRRRRKSTDRMTAEELVAFAESLPGVREPHDSPQRDQWNAALRDRGHDVVTYLRARRWLRAGKPAGYQWER